MGAYRAMLLVVEACGAGVERLRPGDRVGVPWLGWTCGECGYCVSGRENLCAAARFTGYTLDGGYADIMLADARYCLPIGGDHADVEAAPLLCAAVLVMDEEAAQRRSPAGPARETGER